MEGRRKRISLCMIVKNEERQLPRCLKSVQGIVDEIIIVDTGSTDRTVEIAGHYGAAVVHAEWEHDFAKARNAGLAQAEGEWILFLDADEELDAATGKQLLIEADHEAAGLFLQIWNVVGTSGDERGGTVHPVLRMFRNDPNIRFAGRIHEQIAASILKQWPQAVFRLTEVKLFHFGYQHEIIIEKNKLQRNMELLERAVMDEPNNSFHRYNIGVEFLRAGMPDKALEAFRDARRQDGFEQLSYMHLVVKYEVRSLLSLSRWNEAAELASEWAEHFADYPDMHHYYALALAQCGQLRAAARAAEYALRLGAAPGHYHTEDGIGTYRTSYMLGRLKEAQLDTQGVIRAYTASLRHHSTLMPPLYRLCRYLRIAGEEARLVSILAAQLVCRNEEAVLKVADIMSESGCGNAAKQWVNWHAAQYGEEERKLLETWIERAAGAGIERSGDAEEAQEKAAALLADMCERADRHLERLQLALKNSGGLMQKGSSCTDRLGGLEPRSAALSCKAVALIRLLLPCDEGWGPHR